MILNICQSYHNHKLELTQRVWSLQTCQLCVRWDETYPKTPAWKYHVKRKMETDWRKNCDIHIYIVYI